MKKVVLLGRGPSILQLKNYDMSDIADVVLVNDHSKTVEDAELLRLIQPKNTHIICNINNAGFGPYVTQILGVKKCVTNRFKPDWDLWQKHKDLQRKHNEGGHLNTLDKLPYIPEDEPYLFAWRGPKDRNKPEMRTPSGLKIHHMPESAEKYLPEVYKEKLVCNCGYYATLYALCSLQADHVVYFGMDFYQNLKIKKSWYTDPPKYLNSEWKDLRMKYEGEHMKVLWDRYLSRYFPNKKFEFYTTAECSFVSPNIIYNKVDNAFSNITYL